MSKTFALMTAAALLMGASASAQGTDTQAPANAPAIGAPSSNTGALNGPGATNDSAAPANAAPASAAASDQSGSSGDSSDVAMHRPHHRHHARMHGASTDHNADKLNACMANALPTTEQEACLHQAANTGNGSAAQ